MKKTQLNNGITIISKINKNTPRIAVTFYLCLDKPETKAGVNVLLNRLFLQGTEKRTAEEIAEETEENAIELYSEMKADYLRFKGLCLNEDFDCMLELMEDIMLHSTLNSFDKEIIKMKGEIQAELDSPKTKAYDMFYKTLFENHPYGNTYTKILDNIDDIEKSEVEEAYKEIIQNSKKIISVSGDFEEEKLIELLERHFGKMTNNNCYTNKTPFVEIKQDTLKCIEKNDAKQAQILEGWIFPTYTDKEYATISVLNSILGSNGLSSRLFLELREKQGLAYTVRSIYEPRTKCASFTIYIGTEPKNIKTAIDGFKAEIEKIKNIPVGEQELYDAKNSVIGKRGFYFETNALESSVIGMYEAQSLGYNYEEKFIQAIKNVTSEDIQKCAQTYFSQPKVLIVLAPSEQIEPIKNNLL
ncbi:MAG: M16 family metallopeptidase [Candidatus Gastranaerophilaceae bacterium]